MKMKNRLYRYEIDKLMERRGPFCTKYLSV